MSAVLKVVLTKLLSEKVLKAIIIKICEYLASKSSNKLDDALWVKVKEKLNA